MIASCRSASIRSRLTKRFEARFAELEGDLDLRGGFVFHGIVIVQGDLDTQGAGNRISGGVMASNADFDSQSMMGSSVVQYSSCALDQVLLNSNLTRVRPIASRSWIDLSAVIS